jgi:hypothetical protein
MTVHLSALGVRQAHYQIRTRSGAPRKIGLEEID